MGSKETAIKAAIGLLLVFVIVFGSVTLYHSHALASANVGIESLQKSNVVLQDRNSQFGRFQSFPEQGNISIIGLNPVNIYASANRSVVIVQGSRAATTLSLFGSSSTVETVFGSGFVVKYSNSYYVTTNFHVVDKVVNVTVTFWNGDAYPANVIGSDPYSDISVLTTNASASDFVPLDFDSSSSIRVGQPVMAIGNPYGLSGSVTFGIVSQVGRTIQYQSSTGTFTVAGAIQFSAPINPGNSGGPLLDAVGMVVGITSAGVSGAQGVGFAIPSDTIIRELPSLISTGKYDKHSYFGVQGVDMNYQLSQVMGTSVTYGVVIEKTVPGGPADKAGLKGGQRIVTIGEDQYRVGGDVIVSLNGARIVNYDSFSTYLETYTVPGQSVQVGIIRSGSYMVLQVLVGTRPNQ
jgi:S1-C subfamily serine protease